MLIARCQPRIVVTKSYRYCVQPTDLAMFWHKFRISPIRKTELQAIKYR